jgi:hypothetical protein
MENLFFEKPILNAPYGYPSRHWELDAERQPTQRVMGLQQVVEIKGYRREDAKEKKNAMEAFWLPGVNNRKQFGRWALAEFTDVYQIGEDFKSRVEPLFNGMLEEALAEGAR